ncbi:hypothetical protein, partial [Pseudomonas viridiflava]|uniref:hypothetical protein n=1 Tax=Pseudomonas viridiflava TaxID=33069 RepID=UPI0013DF0F47
MKTKNTPEQTAANIATVIELRQAGNTRDQIIEITKFPARFIREHMKGVPILAKPAKVTQLSVAAAWYTSSPSVPKDAKITNYVI